MPQEWMIPKVLHTTLFLAGYLFSIFSKPMVKLLQWGRPGAFRFSRGKLIPGAKYLVKLSDSVAVMPLVRSFCRSVTFSAV
jgi:hypothetical protein